MRYEKALKNDFRYLVNGLREEDLVELVIGTGKLPEQVLHQRVLEIPGSETYTILSGGLVPMAMFGAIPNPCESCDDGVAWFLATRLIEEYSKELLKTIPPYADALSEPYPGGLVAYLWEHNDMHLRWAEAIGFTPVDSVLIRGNRFLKIHRPRR